MFLWSHSDVALVSCVEPSPDPQRWGKAVVYLQERWLGPNEVIGLAPSVSPMTLNTYPLPVTMRYPLPQASAGRMTIVKCTLDTHKHTHKHPITMRYSLPQASAKMAIVKCTLDTHKHYEVPSLSLSHTHNHYEVPSHTHIHNH